MRLGVVGTNFITDWLLEAAEEIPEIQVQAVFSRKQETGEAFAKKHRIPEVYTDFEAFLNGPIDIVYVATPTYAHCRQTLEALKHKKHVLCEKVMAVNEREVQSMVDCAGENQVVLLEAMRPDFDPALQILSANLPRIGKLRRVTMEYCQYSSRYDRFRAGEILNAFNPALSNAAIMDIGVYCIHSLVRLFGAPKSVKACSTMLHNGFEGNGIVLMQYEDMIAEAVYSKIDHSVHPSVFQGEDGSITVDVISKPQKVELILRNGHRELLPYTPVKNNMVYELRKLLELIENHQYNHPYLTHSLNAIRVMDEARRQNGIVFDADILS